MVSNFFITNTLKCTSLDESASFEVGLYIVIGLIRLPVLADRTTCTLQQKCPNKCIGLSAHLRPVHNRQQSCQKLQQSGRKRQKKVAVSGHFVAISGNNVAVSGNFAVNFVAWCGQLGSCLQNAISQLSTP